MASAFEIWEFTWYAELPDDRRRPGQHTVEVQVFDKTGGTWSRSSAFTFTREPAIRPAAGANWPQHHGNAAHGGVAEDTINAGQRLAWFYRTDGTFLTVSPVIVDGVVYAGTRDENSEVRQVRSTEVRIVENSGERAVVRVTGTSSEHPGLTIVTSYTAYADDQFITATTELTNTTAAALPVWAGDALDHTDPVHAARFPDIP
ncbi:MAG TPA: hypothetical protein VFC19_46290 [Candidatus Limnocylindrales bacterium]|nr:hypothetical protein [Candidatus Limnocylindrales bacterium]